MRSDQSATSSSSQRRDRALPEREEQITAGENVYRQLLSDLFWAIEGIRQVGVLGSGLQPPGPISAELETRLQDFIRKFTTSGHSPDELDLRIPSSDDISDLQVKLPERVAANAAQEKLSNKAAHAEMEVEAFIKSEELSTLAGDVAQQPVSAPTACNPLKTAHNRSQPGSPAQSTQQQALAGCPRGSPPKTPNVSLPSARAPRHNSHHQPLPSTTTNLNDSNVLAISFEKSSKTRGYPLSSDCTAKLGGPSRFISPDYASSLPPLPVHIIASRLLAAQGVTGTTSKQNRRQAIRSGLWIGSGGSEITKLAIKSQHIGLKSALKRNDIPRDKPKNERSRLYNVLTTADWKTMLDELQMTRMLEVLDHLKADKAWAYSQLKKPRIPPIQKSHWDHLLDEMSWLQVDFRQERRWKIVTAHRLAQHVVAWHHADTSGKQRLQVKLQYKQRPETSLGGESSNLNCVLTSQASVPASSVARLNILNQPTPDLVSSDHLSPCISTKGSPESSLSIPPHKTPIESSTASTADKSVLAGPDPNLVSSHESRKTLHHLRRSRIPIFDMAPHETMIEIGKLSLDNLFTNPINYHVERVKLHRLFGDLPLFGDLESRSDKRVDEASPHHGRISRIAPYLESKPLLVSTIQPARNCVGNQWKNLGPLSTDDMREHTDLKSDFPPHHPTNLFLSRKSKEVKETNLPHRLSSPPPSERSKELLWTAVDEELLRQICMAYDCNWKITADVFNATSGKLMTEQLTPRDCYDCWTRLNTFPSDCNDTNSSAGHAKSTPDLSSSAVASVVDRNANTDVDIVVSTSNEVLPIRELKRSPEPMQIFPNKRAARDVALQEITQKVKDKRTSEIRKPSVPPGQPRQVILNAHETHAQAIRPYMTPLEMSTLKHERDRQTQAALEMAKRQQQMQQESIFHQARAAAVAAAAQMPYRNATLKIPIPLNGNLPPRTAPQSALVAQGRHGVLPAVAVHRNTSQIPASYASSPPHHGVANRGPVSPTPHGHIPSQTNQVSIESQASSAVPVSSQGSVPAQFSNIPQGFSVSNSTSTLQSPAGSSTSNNQPIIAPPLNLNGLHSPAISHPLTPIQVARYLQQQQRSPEHQLQHQHQQILLHQQMQQHFSQSHSSPPFSHQSIAQVFGQPATQPPHQTSSIPCGQPQPPSGAVNANSSTPSLAISSSPLSQPPT
ncbi:hypothetical protein O181_030943 [Austropuccinia psidii MF-1]|uniref:HSA domain-containing protein n=1 Tax=Austropuccinia psidii MF-1 TaxID=1389203 RepID=A0A9Q3H451_9BASI|nr:hypothetical protein [Austropuccinia psidii MF-1]